LVVVLVVVALFSSGAAWPPGSAGVVEAEPPGTVEEVVCVALPAGAVAVTVGAGAPGALDVAVEVVLVDVSVLAGAVTSPAGVVTCTLLGTVSSLTGSAPPPQPTTRPLPVPRAKTVRRAPSRALGVQGRGNITPTDSS
jgi:hypothetical protein